MVSSMSHCQPAEKTQTLSDTSSFEGSSNGSLNPPTDNRVLLKGHFGQGQFFYESANCEENGMAHQKRPFN